MMIKRD